MSADAPEMKRTDSASRVIKASPQTIHQAFLDPEAVAVWRPPQGMAAEIYAFDPREGGTFRMAFVYTAADRTIRGKTSANADVFQGRFLEMVPNERIVEVVDFESDDPAFANAMMVTTTLAAVPEGTEVSFVCENVPSGIRPSDHQVGMASTLKQLVAFTE